MQLLIDTELAQAIRRYLGTCPHDLVNGLIVGMEQMKAAEVPKETPKEHALATGDFRSVENGQAVKAS